MSGIRVRDLSVAYNGTDVLHGVDLVVGPGEIVAVIGPNGAGKTTLLRAIAGAVPVRTGDTAVAGIPVSGMSRREAARTLAVVPQNPVVPGGMTVLDYVLLGRTPYIGYWGTESAGDVHRAREILERLDAARFAGRSIDRLSGGERQRVVLARALAQDAPALLLDEPTTALDIGHQQNVLDMVDGLRRDRPLSVLSAFHDLTLAAQYADRMVLLVEGSVLADGSPATVLRPEALELFSGARVTIMQGPDGEPVVVPRRA